MNAGERAESHRELQRKAPFDDLATISPISSSNAPWAATLSGA